MLSKIIDHAITRTVGTNRSKQAAELTKEKRKLIFTLAKLIDLTKRYFDKVTDPLITQELTKSAKFKRHPFSRLSLPDQKNALSTIITMVNGFEQVNAGLAKELYVLNTIFSREFFRLIAPLGLNGHEKAAILYLAQQHFLDEMYLNQIVLDHENMTRKEFDVTIINPHQGNILVEVKSTLGRDGFRQIFGYSDEDDLHSRRMPHTHVLSNPGLCFLNDLPVIDRIEIIYSAISSTLERYDVFEVLSRIKPPKPKKLTLKRFQEVAADLIEEKHFRHLREKTKVTSIVFRRIDPQDFDLRTSCLNPRVILQYERMLDKK